MIANFKDKMTGGGKPVVVEQLSVTENGTYTPQSGVDCFNPVTVDVPQATKGFDVSQISKTFIVNTSVESFDKTGLDIGKCTRFYCSNPLLTSLDISYLETSNLKSFSIYLSSSGDLDLVSIDMSGLDLSNLTVMNFYKLSNLQTIKCDGLKLPDIDLTSTYNYIFNLTSATKLTVDSLVGLINALPQSTNNYSFQIGQTNIAKLSDEQKAIATNKGFTLI